MFGFALVVAGLLAHVSLVVVMALQFAFFVTTARALPNVSALALAHRARDAGSASALLDALQSFASMMTGAAIAFFNNGTLLPLALLMTASVTISAILHRWMLRSRH